MIDLAIVVSLVSVDTYTEGNRYCYLLPTVYVTKGEENNDPYANEDSRENRYHARCRRPLHVPHKSPYAPEEVSAEQSG